MTNSVPYRKLPFLNKIYLRLKYQPYYFLRSLYCTFCWMMDGFQPHQIDFEDSPPLVFTKFQTFRGIFHRNNVRAWHKIDSYIYSREELEEMLNECFSGKS